jgi:ArsR family transcriptional regulator, arsenate/arsenite/antimonite-responsive transcriptional repressor
VRRDGSPPAIVAEADGGPGPAPVRRDPLTAARPPAQHRDYLTSRIATTGPALRSTYTRALPRAWQPVARVFTALGDPHRQRILLMFERDERLSIGEIVAASTLSRTAVAHHLRVLRDAGVLRSEKVGREVWFWPDPAPVRAALDAVDDYLATHFRRLREDR